MEALALYLIKSTVWLTGFALVYLLFLRNERFFLLNRIYLISGILVSIVFPLFTWHYTVMLSNTPTVEVSELQMMGTVDIPEPFPTQAILLYIYLAGALYLLFRVTRQTITVLRVIRKSEILPFSSAKLIRTTDYPASFSFFSFVFVNPSTCDTETNEIVNHEMEHIRQKHWIDLLLFQVLLTLQWFNPVGWLYGHFIRQNHEYLADERALQRSSNPGIYRAALLNQLFGGPVISLANSFNYSLNKKRFNMMKQTINSPFRKLKLLLVLPLIALVFYAFATPEYEYSTAKDKSIFTIQDTKAVTGKVQNADGNALKGANIVIAGTSIGTVTDANGNFNLEMTDDSPLVISHIGYESQKVTPTFEKEMLISMKKVTRNVDEVTVVALATNSKQSSSIKQPFKVQTNAPLQFRDSDGSNNPPLTVINGVIAENQNVNNIDPETIESINVLKGESSNNKYGDKGKNGVIEITLKKDSDLKKEPTDLKVNGDAKNQKENGTYMAVQVMPRFPGGPDALSTYIHENVKYPAIARQKGIQGKVIVNFVVTKTGRITHAQVVNAVDPLLDQEAIRVIESMPTWKPGNNNGENIDVAYGVPIDFKLDNTKTEGVKTSDSPVFFIVEEMPEFPGGDEALRNFIAANVKYPAVATQKGIQGKVYITFVVTKTGSVTNAEVARGVDASLDQEAIRVIESLPTWIPGKQKGVNVAVSYTVPINFVLEPSKISDEKLRVNNNQSDQVFFIVEEMPEFPGGDEALRNFIAANVKYPASAAQKSIQGKVYINFVVTKTGSVTNAKVARGVDPSLDQEAIRVVESLPTWKPGKQNGENVNVSYTLPINFKLQKGSDEATKPAVDQTTQKHELIIVPNPTSDKAMITLKGSESKNNLDVSVYDSYGKMIMKESKNGPTFTLSVAKLTTGTYLVVATDGTIQFQGHLVVNH